MAGRHSLGASIIRQSMPRVAFAAHKGGPWAACGESVRAALRGIAGRVRIDAEFLDLAGDGVAAKAQQLRSLYPTVAGRMHRAADQHALELTLQTLVDLAGRFRQQPIGFGPSAWVQLPRLGEASPGSRISGGRSASSTTWPGAMTVSQ